MVSKEVSNALEKLLDIQSSSNSELVILSKTFLGYLRPFGLIDSANYSILGDKEMHLVLRVASAGMLLTKYAFYTVIGASIITMADRSLF